MTLSEVMQKSRSRSAPWPRRHEVTARQATLRPGFPTPPKAVVNHLLQSASTTVRTPLLGSAAEAVEAGVGRVSLPQLRCASSCICQRIARKHRARTFASSCISSHRIDNNDPAGVAFRKPSELISFLRSHDWLPALGVIGKVLPNQGVPDYVDICSENGLHQAGPLPPSDLSKAAVSN